MPAYRNQLFPSLAGFTFRAINSAYSSSTEGNTLIFGERYLSVSDACCRFASILTGPLFSLFCTCLGSLVAIFGLVKGLLQAVRHDKETEHTLDQALIYGSGSVVMLIMSVMSPVLNSLDFIIGGINTVLEANSNTAPSV